MRKLRDRRAQRLKNLDLSSGVGDMVFAAHHMTDRHVDIISHRRQGVEKRAILAHQHRIGHGGGVNFDRAAHQVCPAHLAARQLEAPVRLAALTFPFRLVRRLQRSAIVDRRQLARSQQRTLPLQLTFGLKAGIDAARRLELIESHAVLGHAVDLAVGAVMRQPQPLQVAINRLLEFLGRSRRIGIVDAQQKAAAMFLGEQPVQQRGAGIADMQQACGRRREADSDRHQRASRKALVMG